MQKVARLIAEVTAGLFYLVFKDIRKTGILLFALFFCLIMLDVANKYGRSPVPYPFLFVVLGTIFIVKNWK